MSPSHPPDWTLRIDFAVFYLLLAVGPASLGWDTLVDYSLRIDTFQWLTSHGRDYVSPSYPPNSIFTLGLKRDDSDLDLDYTAEVRRIVPFQTEPY